MTHSFHATAKAKTAFILRALNYRNYRLFFTGQIISLIGTWMTNVATGWLVYRLTGSALMLGLIGFAGQLPAFLLVPFAGLLVDRHSRHRILVITQTLSMAESLILAALTLTHRITIPWLLGLSVFQGLINAFDMPCRQTFVVEMIENRKDLSNAIALNSSMFNLARLIGPAIGGVLIAAVGEGWCFLIDGLSYIAVLAAILSMTVKPPVISKQASMRPRQQLHEGWKYVVGSTAIRSIITLLALVSLVGVPYTVLMPIFAGTVLGGGPHTLGFLMAAVGVGALAGALWLAARKSVLGLGRMIGISTVIFGTGLILFSFSRVLWVCLAALVISGFGFMVQVASSNTILQTIVPDDKRGRVMSFFVMAVVGTAPFGSLLAGALSEKIGVPHTLFLCGIACALGGLWFYRQLPAFRETIRPIYRKLGIIPEVASGLEAAAELSVPPKE